MTFHWLVHTIYLHTVQFVLLTNRPLDKLLNPIFSILLVFSDTNYDNYASLK